MIFLMDHKGGPLAREFQGYRRALGLDLTTPYFNAGLMAVDRAAWRKAGFAEEAAARLRGEPERFPFMEQDALNSLVRGDFAPLSPRYNFMGDFFLTGLEAEIAPIVLHFVNQPKPWHYAEWRGEGRFARAYADWFATSPFPEWRAAGASAGGAQAEAEPAAAPFRRLAARLSREPPLRRCLTKRYSRPIARLRNFAKKFVRVKLKLSIAGDSPVYRFVMSPRTAGRGFDR